MQQIVSKTRLEYCVQLLLAVCVCVYVRTRVLHVSSFVLTYRNPLGAYEMLYERFKTYVCEVTIII